VHVVRFRYINILRPDADSLQTMQHLLQDHVVNSALVASDLKLEDLLALPCNDEPTICKQFELLSVISNNHWKPYLTLTGALSSDLSAISLLRHLAFCPKTGILPTSSRNRLIYFLANSNCQQARKLAIHLVEPLMLSTVTHVDDVDSDEHPVTSYSSGDLHAASGPPAKRARRVVSLSQSDLQHALAPNMLVKHSSQQYTSFRERLICDGRFCWRCHSVDGDIFLLNEYCPQTGEFLPACFAHVTRTSDGSEPVYMCSCSIYTFLQQKAIASLADKSVDNIAVRGLTCMHCRFVAEEVEQKIDLLLQGSLLPSTPINQKLIDSQLTLNNGVVLVSNSNAAALKFSVCASSGHGLATAFVHLSKDGSFIACMSGECRATAGCKKKAQYLLDDGNRRSGVICRHLEVMRANCKQWRHLVVHADLPDGEPDVEPVNRDDEDLMPAQTDNELQVEMHQ
jgi:hypothetical protein